MRRERKWYERTSDLTRKIFTAFFKPLVKSSTYNTEEEALKNLFCVNTRDIRLCYSKQAFNLYMCQWVTITIRGQMKKFRINKGDALIVGTDTTAPDRVDIQFGGDKQERFYCIDGDQYKRIEPYLEFLDEQAHSGN